MPQALDHLAAAYREPDQPARRWKRERGGRTVGYVDDMVPVAMIAAAGFLPHRVSGDPSGGHAPVMAYAGEDIRAEPLEFVNSIFHRLTSGAYDFLDHLVIPASRKSVLLLHARLLAFANEHPGYAGPRLHILDKASTRSFVGSRFNRTQILKFKAKLEAWAGAPLGDQALASASAAEACKHVLLGELQRLRSAALLSGVEALQILGAARSLPTNVFNRLLEEALAEVSVRQPLVGLKVMVAGSPLDNTSLYELLERHGLIVVGETHDWGAARMTASDPALAASAPLEQIADAYHRAPTSIVFPIDEAVRMCVETAEAAGAQAVIFNVFARDDAQLWEVPLCRQALEARGICSLYLSEQPYRITEPAPIVEAVSAFVQSTGGRS